MDMEKCDFYKCFVCFSVMSDEEKRAVIEAGRNRHTREDMELFVTQKRRRVSLAKLFILYVIGDCVISYISKYYRGMSAEWCFDILTCYEKTNGMQIDK